MHIVHSYLITNAYTSFTSRFRLKSEFEREVLRRLWDWENNQSEPEREDSEREDMRLKIQQQLRDKMKVGDEL